MAISLLLNPARNLWLVVIMYIRFPLSLRNVDDLLHERGIDTSHEGVRFWWHRFGQLFAKINGERCYLRRAVDHEGEVLESFVTRTRDKKAASNYFEKSHAEAPPQIQLAEKGAVSDHIENNSYHPFRRRDRAMIRPCFNPQPLQLGTQLLLAT